MSQELEWQTRKTRIDQKMLNPAGWTVAPFQAGQTYSKHAITEVPTDNGPADYALSVNGVVLGIVEAKKLNGISRNDRWENVHNY